MKRETVDTMIRDYKRYLARTRYIEAILPKLEKDLLTLRASAIVDSLPLTVHLTGMPHGSSGGNRIEEAVAKFIDGFEPKYITEAQEHIDRLKAELETKSTTVQCVEAWLMGLSTKERFVFERKVFEGATWSECATEFNKRFNACYSRDGLLRYKRLAMKKIYAAADDGDEG